MDQHRYDAVGEFLKRHAGDGRSGSQSPSRGQSGHRGGNSQTNAGTRGGWRGGRGAPEGGSTHVGANPRQVFPEHAGNNQGGMTDEEFGVLIAGRLSGMNTLNRYAAMGMAIRLGDLSMKMPIFVWGNELRTILDDGEFTFDALTMLSRSLAVFSPREASFHRDVSFVLGLGAYANYWTEKSSLARKMMLFALITQETNAFLHGQVVNSNYLNELFGSVYKEYPITVYKAYRSNALKRKSRPLPSDLPIENADIMYRIVTDRLDVEVEHVKRELARSFLMRELDDLHDPIPDLVAGQEGDQRDLGIIYDNIFNTAIELVADNSGREFERALYDDEHGYPVDDITTMCNLITSQEYGLRYAAAKQKVRAHTKPIRRPFFRHVSRAAGDKSRTGITNQDGTQTGNQNTEDRETEDDDRRGQHEDDRRREQERVRREEETIRREAMTAGSDDLPSDAFFAQYIGPVNAGDTLRALTDFVTLSIEDSSFDIYMPEEEPTVRLLGRDNVTVAALDSAAYNRRLKYALWIAPLTTGYAKIVEKLSATEGYDNKYAKHFKAIIACLIACAASVGNEIKGGELSILALDKDNGYHKELVKKINAKFRSEFGLPDATNALVFHDIIKKILHASLHISAMSIIVGCFSRQGHLNALSQFPARRFEDEFSVMLQSWISNLTAYYQETAFPTADASFMMVHEKPKGWAFLIKKTMFEYLWDHAKVSYAVRYLLDEPTRNSSGVFRGLSGKNRFDGLAPPCGMAEIVSGQAVLEAISESVSTLFDDNVRGFIEAARRFKAPGLWRFRYSSLSMEVLGYPSISTGLDTGYSLRLAGSMVDYHFSNIAAKKQYTPASRTFNAISLRRNADPRLVTVIQGLMKLRRGLETRISTVLTHTEYGEQTMAAMAENAINSFASLQQLIKPVKRRYDQAPHGGEDVVRDDTSAGRRRRPQQDGGDNRPFYMDLQSEGDDDEDEL